MLCVFWHRSSVELDSRHSQHSSVSLGQPCLCCQFTGYPLIDIMNTGKIPPQDVFKDALTPISKLSIHWSLSFVLVLMWWLTGHKNPFSSISVQISDLGYPAPLWIAPHQPGLLLPGLLSFFPD